jgi:hypothetical protein
MIFLLFSENYLQILQDSQNISKFATRKDKEQSKKLTYDCYSY